MKRFAVSAVAILLFLGGLLLGKVTYWVVAGNADGALKDDGRPKVVWNGNVVKAYGRTGSFDIPDAEDVEIAHSFFPVVSDDRLFLEFVVTIKRDRPLLIAKETYDQIHDGMTYKQVGKAMGGVMTKGRMSENFCGDIEIKQGTHRMRLYFVDGRLFNKSAGGMRDDRAGLTSSENDNGRSITKEMP